MHFASVNNKKFKLYSSYIACVYQSGLDRGDDFIYLLKEKLGMKICKSNYCLSIVPAILYNGLNFLLNGNRHFLYHQFI